MPCNIAQNLKRVLWEYDDLANAPCSAQDGFQLDGSMARQYWFEFDETPQPPPWDTFNAGRILTFDNPVQPGQTGDFEWADALGTTRIDLNYFGHVEVQEPEMSPWTVDVQIDLQVPIVAVPPFRIVRAGFRVLKPNNNRIWIFSNWEQVIPEGPPFFLPSGDATVYPLKRCHDCT